MVLKNIIGDWATEGEHLEVGLVARLRDVGSRVGGIVRAPHPPPTGAPETIAIKQEQPTPAAWTAAGAFAGLEWVEDPALGWWAEATHAAQNGIRFADFLAVGCGQAGVFLSQRRMAVVLPEKLLANVHQATTANQGFLGRAMGALFESNEWVFRDKVVSLYEIPREGLRSWSVAMVGRSFPFPRLIRFEFTDGSTLYARTNTADIIAGR